MESSETNRRDIHKIYLLKEVYIKVHRNSDDGAAPPPGKEVKKRQGLPEDVKKSC